MVRVVWERMWLGGVGCERLASEGCVLWVLRAPKLAGDAGRSECVPAEVEGRSGAL